MKRSDISVVYQWKTQLSRSGSEYLQFAIIDHIQSRVYRKFGLWHPNARV